MEVNTLRRNLEAVCKFYDIPYRNLIYNQSELRKLAKANITTIQQLGGLEEFSRHSSRMLKYEWGILDALIYEDTIAEYLNPSLRTYHIARLRVLNPDSNEAHLNSMCDEAISRISTYESECQLREAIVTDPINKVTSFGQISQNIMRLAKFLNMTLVEIEKVIGFPLKYIATLDTDNLTMISREGESKDAKVFRVLLSDCCTKGNILTEENYLKSKELGEEVLKLSPNREGVRVHEAVAEARLPKQIKIWTKPSLDREFQLKQFLMQVSEDSVVGLDGLIQDKVQLERFCRMAEFGVHSPHDFQLLDYAYNNPNIQHLLYLVANKEE